MKPDKKTLAILLLAAAFVAAAALGVMRLRAPVPTQSRVQSIKVQAVGQVQKENALELTGSVEAVQNAVVSAKSAGRVSEISVENGTRVAAGDILVKVEDTDYINQLAASQAVLDKALTNLASLTQDYSRGKTLFQAGAISQKAMDDLENGLKAARADVAAAEASVANAREALAGASIRAPISGLVANRNVKLGQMLAAGTPVLLVEDLTEVFVLVKVGQKDLDYIKIGLDCSVGVDTYPDQKFTGRVMVINPAAEAGSRVFECKIKVKNPGELLKPGMFARVSIKIGEDQPVLAVPLEALSSKQGLYYVLVPEGDVVKEKKVEIGALMGTMVEIKSGLSDGQTIVISNVNKLKDGDHIQISSGQGIEPMFLSDLSLKRPVLAVVTILALVAAGVVSFLNLNINDWPDIEFPYVSVTIIHAGASPEQMESDVAVKLEEAMGQVSGVKHVYARASEGVATVWAEFTLETNPQVATQDVRDKLGRIRGELPEGIEEPIIARFEPSARPIMTLAVTGDRSVREMSIPVDDLLKKRLEAVPGVGAVNIIGSEEREVQILLDKQRLSALSLSPYEVVASLKGENLEIPAGSLQTAENKISLRTAGKLSRIDEYLQLPVARRNGVQLYVKDVATVVDGIKDRDSMARYQGKPAIGVEIIKQSGSNTVEVAEQIKAALEELKGEMPAGVSVEVVRDNSANIRSSVNDVLRTLIEGSLLAVLTVFLFLRNTRSTLISGLAIPTSIIVTFSAMKIMGFTLNNMSLIALSLSVGLLIDDAIVVIENIIRHLHMGKTPMQAAREATGEIGLAVMATTFTVVAVFIPVGMMTGEVGQFFKQFGITVAFSVVVSLLVSFTLTPVLASKYLTGSELQSGPVGRFLNWFNRGFDRFTGLYLSVLDRALAHRGKTLGIALGLFAASMAVVPFMGTSFVPTGDLGEVSMSGELDSGLTLEGATGVSQQVEKVLAEYPEVVKVYSTINEEQIEFFVKTVDKSDRSQTIKELMADIRQRLQTVPGIRISMLYNNGIIEEKEWEYRVQGDDLDLIRTYSEQAERILESIPGTVDLASSSKPGKPELSLAIKHQEAADLRISTAQIAQTMNILFTGSVVGRFNEGEDSFDVRVRLPEEQRHDLKDLNNLFLTSAYEVGSTGYQPQIALSQVTEPVFSTTPGVITRSDRSREIVLSGNVNGISLGELNERFFDRVDKEIELPQGYRIYAGGDSERMADTFDSMSLALIMGILFIFLILAAQFESYLEPLAIMLALPMAAIGAILGLLIAGQNLNLVSMIGIIMLMGLVTKNAILLIDFTKKARASGLSREEALRQAASIRLRPILMTSTAMICGMIPLVLALGLGSEQRAPMADAAVGGLITSTILTLVVVPVIYSLLDDLRNKFGRRKEGQVEADM